jgi:acyl-CoA synthetase (AMP-forming)/AMP-acid ligase II
VVPAGGGPLDASALEAFCRAELASFKVPRAFVAVDALPRTALGKVRKKALVEAFGRSSSRGPGPPGEV